MDIPLPPTFQVYHIDETPWTGPEADEFHRKCDLDSGRIFLHKMTALGYTVTLEEATNVYKDKEERTKIEEEFWQLGVDARVDAFNNLLDIFEKKIRG